MAILKNTVQVNSGNTGWTRSNVLDALEETIADLGWNSGSQVNGVVTSLAHPANSDSVWGDHYHEGIAADWNHCGGPGITMRPVSTHKYSVDDNGTGYVFQRYYTASHWGAPAYYLYTSTFIPEHLVDGAPLIFRTSDPALTPPGISNGDTVYVVRHPEYPVATDQYGVFALTATEADALARTNLLAQTGNAAWRFYDPAHTDNTQLMSGINQGDTLFFADNDLFPYAKGGSAPIAYSLTTNSGDGSDYNISGTDRSTTHTNASDPGITVYEGDTITFDNSDLSGSHPMYIRVSDGGASVSSPAASGEGTDTVSWTPTTAGTYYYQCSVSGHEGMIGTITVTSAPTGNSAITAHPLWFQDAPGAYDTTRGINITNYSNNIANMRGMPSLSYGYFGETELTWLITGWEHDKTYYIKSQNDATYTVSFTIGMAPGRNNNYENYLENPYYDYTVPQDGSRSALNLRIYRQSSTTPSKIAGIRVRDLNSTGWSETDTFTIPGTAVGGVSPENDILVGVSTDESSPGLSDGTASLHVTNFGAGVNAYIKNPARNQIMFKLENDATKTYGTTYHLIELTDDHTIAFNSGSSIDFLGSDTTSAIADRAGRWGGVVGLDWTTSYGSNLITTGAYDQVTQLDFATSSTPTAYPLKIVTYRAQSPQDTDFAIISFVQTINGVDTTYATWFYHKGNNYGNGIWDLDYVWQGGLTTITPTTSSDYSLMFSTSGGHVRDGSYEREDSQGEVAERIMREAFYGYFRSTTTDDTYGFSQSLWSSNMWTDNSIASTSSTVTPYFRHHEYDDVVHSNTENNDRTYYIANQNDYEAQKNKSMPAEANYYRPLKGLPIDVSLAPCPYYLPDDFVMIPFDISPGMASIRPGDTVTISGSEVYEVVRASYENNDETYDGITDNRTRGIIFAARTT